MRPAFLGITALLLATGAAPAAPGDEPVPEGAVLSVSTEKPEYLLGERVVLRMRLTNTADRPFRIEPAIWQRFAVRDECVTVAMTDQDGRPAWDPFPEKMGGGGPSVDGVTLARGKSWGEDVELWRYRIPDRAGTWRIRLSRTFNWVETLERPNPSAEVVLRFREPTAEEAKRVLDGLQALDARARFYSAAYPVYVPLLEARAAAGLAAAAEGLALDRDPAATSALLRLFASKDRAVAARAAGFLLERIRVPEKDPDGGRVRYRQVPRGFLHADEDMAPLWRPEYEPPARAAARAFLAGEGFPIAGAPAEVLCLVGTAEDGPVVAAALDRLALEFEKPCGSDDWKRQGDLDRDEDALLSAAWRLGQRGYAAPAAPEGAGESLVWLQSLREKEGKDRPAEWWETLKRLAAHPRVLVRKDVASFARRRDPEMPETCRLVVARLAGDPDERVRKAAGAER